MKHIVRGVLTVLHSIVIFPAVLAFYLLLRLDPAPSQWWKQIVALPLYFTFGLFGFLGSCVEWVEDRIVPRRYIRADPVEL